MTVLNLAVTDEADDGSDNGSAWSDQSSPYAAGEFFTVKETPGATQTGGVRFRAVTIPQGATINTASLTITNRNTGNGSMTSMTTFADDVDDAPLFSNSSRPTSGFTDTTASSVVSSPTGADAAEIVFDDSNFIAIVQEIVDRGGWVSGNSMRFSLVPDATYSSRDISDWQLTPSDTTAEVAQLDVDYTAGGGGGRIMGSLAGHGGLAGIGGLAGRGGGLAG